jgi:hypothetical protein
MVVWGLPLSEILDSMNVAKDIEYSQPLDFKLSWIHRRVDETDIYFMANTTDSPQDIDVRFRVSGKEAELWYPDTGAVKPAGYKIENGLTTIPLHLAQRESVFVVFRKAASSESRVIPNQKSIILEKVAGPWDINFPPKLGAPEKIQLNKLESWTENSNQGLKYFSGTATYNKTVLAPQSWFRPGEKIMLNLGIVKDVAEVWVNGKALGTLWKEPYQVDVTDTLKSGTNQLEIKVTNEWTNRLIGDRSASAEKKVLTAGHPMMLGFGRPPPLVESGLIGPVMLVSVENH